MLVRINGTAEVLAAACLAAMTGIVTIDVVSRYVFNAPIASSIELVETMIVGCVFLALPAASATGTHVTIDYFERALSRRLAAAVGTMANVLIAAVLAYLAHAMARRGLEMIVAGDQSPVLRLPVGGMALVMGGCCALTALVHAFAALARGGPPDMEP